LQVERRGSESADVFSRARAEMVERDLRARGIKDARVLAAMASVPRHLFVPEPLRAAAYEDRPLPIGAGQTISQPYIVAFMTELLELKGDEAVLEIGTGSGYQTAVLARLARAVFSIEILPALSERAEKVLAQIGVTNVQVKVGDGFFGWQEKAPFEAILLTASAPEVPEPLWRQLREGGRLVMPLGEENRAQRLVRYRKVRGQPVAEDLTGVMFVPLTGAIRGEKR
jgi:protein-L-isoaspartate(D-aspartate) O-methyltransferase